MREGDPIIPAQYRARQCVHSAYQPWSAVPGKRHTFWPIVGTGVELDQGGNLVDECVVIVVVIGVIASMIMFRNLLGSVFVLGLAWPVWRDLPAGNNQVSSHAINCYSKECQGEHKAVIRQRGVL